MSVQWTNLDEFKDALRQLPADLTAEAAHIMEDHANGAAVAVRQSYSAHIVTGRLLKGVFVTPFWKGKYTPGLIVKSVAKHAWLFDNGSQARHWASGKSTGTMWGKTPPTHVFGRTVMRFRRRMYDQLKDLLVRHGLLVSGEA